MNKTAAVAAGVVAIVAIIAVAFWAVDIDITEEGRLPSAEVDVDVDPGKLPEADIDTVDVDVGTKKQEVLVPDVKVTVEEETITLPTIDIDPPDAGSSELRRARVRPRPQGLARPRRHRQQGPGESLRPDQGRQATRPLSALPDAPEPHLYRRDHAQGEELPG